MGISFKRGRRKRGSYTRAPQKLHRTNGEIRAKEVRVIDADEGELGVMSLSDAQALAREQGVDLIEISAKAVPPVCKIMDYGKMLYAHQKKEQKKKMSQKKHEMKGIRISFRMGEGDEDRMVKQSIDFLSAGHPIKIQLMMKGREKAHKDLAQEKLTKFINRLQEVGQLENIPRVAGHQIVAILKSNKPTKT